MQLARIVDILDHTHVLSRSLLLLSHFSSLRRNNSNTSAALDRRPENAFASRVLRLHSCSTYLKPEVRSLCSFHTVDLLRARLHSHVHHISRGRLQFRGNRDFEMSRVGDTAAVSFLAKYLSHKRECVIPRGKSGDFVQRFLKRKILAHMSCGPRILILVFCAYKLCNLICRFFSTFFYYFL